MKNLLLVVLAVFIVGSGYFYLQQSPVSSPAPAATPSVVADKPSEPDQTFTIKGLDFTYDVKEIKVKKGEKISINFVNTQGFHDLKIDELSVATKQIKAGESEVVTFTPDKVGTFEYYCSVGKHRQNGMWGKITVEE